MTEPTQNQLKFLRKMCLESIMVWAVKAAELGRPLDLLEIHNLLCHPEDKAAAITDCVPQLVSSAIVLQRELTRHQDRMGYIFNEPEEG